MAVDIDRVIGWLDKADKIFKTPIVRLTLMPLLGNLIPKNELTEAQLTQLRDHFADLDARQKRAAERAGRP